MIANGLIPRHLAGRINDARGRGVKQLDPIALYLLRQHDVIDEDTLRAIANEKGVRIAIGERAALIGGLCGALLALSILSCAFVTGDIRNAPFPTGLLYLCALPWMIWYGIKRKRLGKVAAAMLGFLRCPHCGYNIRDLPTDPTDGLTICPECGCAWRLDDSHAVGEHSNG